MARKVGQTVRRGDRTWLARAYSGRDPGSKKRKGLDQTVHGGIMHAQSQLNRMLSERDSGRNLDSSKQTLGGGTCLGLAGRAKRFILNGRTH